MSIGETFGFFLTGDINTTALPLPVLSNDRLAVVRVGETFYASALALTGLVPALQIATPVSGATVTMTAPALYVNTGALAALTVRLPPGDATLPLVEICFAAPVTALTIQDAAGVTVPASPTNGFGPGAAIQMRYINGVIGWIYWK
jgi:hypothetical protein